MSARKPFRQSLTTEQEQGLYEAIDRARPTTRMVKVDKDALFALLVDYGRALDALTDGYEDRQGISDPDPGF